MSIASRLAQRLPFFYGWIVLAVGFVTLGFAYTARSTFSLLYPPILAEFGWDRGLTASIFSIGFLSIVLYAPLVAITIERFGPHLVFPIATVFVAAGFVLTALSSEPWHFILGLGVLVVGGTTVLAFNGHFVFVPRWFEARRGLALGIVSSGVGVAALAVLPLFQWAIETIGWRQGCLVSAIVFVVVLAPLNWLLQRRAPEDLGLSPDGRSGGSVGGQGVTERQLVVVDEVWAATDWTLRRAVWTARFWLVAIGFATSLFAWYALMVHQTQYLLDVGFDGTFAAAALGLVSAFGIAGQVGLGMLSDRIGREWVWTLSVGGFALAALLLMALAARPEPWLAIVMVGVQGAFGYALPAVYGAVPADLFQGRGYGLIYAALTVFGSVGAAIGPWVFGALYDATGSYDWALWVEIGVAAVSCASIWLAAPRHVRRVRRLPDFGREVRGL
jgi:MFS family permease